ncbi:helix-turn-helix domain-containing protein [Streptomyces sp. NPDC102264]|uniref:helix-turn-helix domain-containing protein n=1 Tax=Streptomyces sp. NPDC102264 TaxID=3366149 RepID=UPI00380D0114
MARGALMSPSKLSKIENAKLAPSAADVERILSALGVTTGWSPWKRFTRRWSSRTRGIFSCMPRSSRGSRRQPFPVRQCEVWSKESETDSCRNRKLGSSTFPSGR